MSYIFHVLITVDDLKRGHEIDKLASAQLFLQNHHAINLSLSLHQISDVYVLPAIFEICA